MSKSEIAALAAQMAVEEGLEWGLAKRRAVKQLGLGPRTALPSNDLLEDEVRAYLALFCADTQPAELRVLRQIAARWMARLHDFRPHLCGAVWYGTATRLSDVYLQLFCDDPKSAEISLIDRGVRFEVSSVTGFQGEPVDALSLHEPCPDWGEVVGIHLLIHDADDVRGALKPDAKQRPPRGDLKAVLALIAKDESQ